MKFRLVIVVVVVLMIATAFRPPATRFRHRRCSGTSCQPIQMTSHSFDTKRIDHGFKVMLLGLGIGMFPVDMHAVRAAPVPTVTSSTSTKSAEEVAITAATEKKEAGKARVNKLSSDVKSGKNKKGKITSELQKLDATLNETKKRIRSGQLDSARLATMENQRDTTQKKIQQMNVELTGLNKELARNEAEISSLIKKLTDDDKFIQQKQNELKRKEESAAKQAADKKAQDLNKQISQVSKEKNSAEDSAKKATSTKNDIEKKIQSTLDNQKRDVEAAKKLESAVSKLEENLSKSKSDLASARSKVAATEDKLAALKATEASVEGELKSSQAAAKQAANKLQGLQKQVVKK
eukprot:CAMPEP_0174980814 /NCGR_PEP_ID=MMETSP0004_2-20121128/15552_1 /TAXON_ID=420556 /ORGANISM="Ochromonas sp., Strain CCMP1393" /LENGTH=349 /DNA_ID=CAMNT_0016232507 /DNA_START=39 /DNA_END=1088 /DNA_ORIENTATION=+